MDLCPSQGTTFLLRYFQKVKYLQQDSTLVVSFGKSVQVTFKYTSAALRQALALENVTHNVACATCHRVLSPKPGEGLATVSRCSRALASPLHYTTFTSDVGSNQILFTSSTSAFRDPHLGSK